MLVKVYFRLRLRERVSSSVRELGGWRWKLRMFLDLERQFWDNERIAVSYGVRSKEVCASQAAGFGGHVVWISEEGIFRPGWVIIRFV
jgi:hypothetical protein